MIRQGSITGNYYDGTAKYEPVEPIDPELYETYKLLYMGKRQPNGMYYRQEDVALALGCSGQMVFDMATTAQVENANRVLRRK